MSDYSNSINSAVRDELQRERRAANISQREMGEQLGISRQAVFSKLVKGNLKFEDFIAMSEILDTSPITILEKAIAKTKSATPKPPSSNVALPSNNI